MFAATTCHHDLDGLLRRFLAGDVAAREILPKVAERYVLKIVRGLAADLPDDIHYEVVNQVFENLMLQKSTSYQPARGSAGTFLKLFIRTAIRQVRANYAPPGHVTRIRRKKGAPVTRVVPPAVLSIDDLQEADVPSVDSGVSAVEAKHDLDAVLRRAAPWLAASLKRLHFGEESMNDVAADAGISRFTLSREIDEFAQEARAAA